MIENVANAESLSAKADRLSKRKAKVAVKSNGRYVKYLGPELNRASERVITAENWAEIGIKADANHVWDFKNEYLLPESVFTPAQLNYLLNVDGFFSSVEI